MDQVQIHQELKMFIEEVPDVEKQFYFFCIYKIYNL